MGTLDGVQGVYRRDNSILRGRAAHAARAQGLDRLAAGLGVVRSVLPFGDSWDVGDATAYPGGVWNLSNGADQGFATSMQAGCKHVVLYYHNLPQNHDAPAVASGKRWRALGMDDSWFVPYRADGYAARAPEEWIQRMVEYAVARHSGRRSWCAANGFDPDRSCILSGNNEPRNALADVAGAYLGGATLAAASAGDTTLQISGAADLPGWRARWGGSQEKNFAIGSGSSARFLSAKLLSDSGQLTAVKEFNGTGMVSGILASIAAGTPIRNVLTDGYSPSVVRTAAAYAAGVTSISFASASLSVYYATAAGGMGYCDALVAMDPGGFRLLRGTVATNGGSLTNVEERTASGWVTGLAAPLAADVPLRSVRTVTGSNGVGWRLYDDKVEGFWTAFVAAVKALWPDQLVSTPSAFGGVSWQREEPFAPMWHKSRTAMFMAGWAGDRPDWIEAADYIETHHYMNGWGGSDSISGTSVEWRGRVGLHNAPTVYVHQMNQIAEAVGTTRASRTSSPNGTSAPRGSAGSPTTPGCGGRPPGGRAS